LSLLAFASCIAFLNFNSKQRTVAVRVAVVSKWWWWKGRRYFTGPRRILAESLKVKKWREMEYLIL